MFIIQHIHGRTWKTNCIAEAKLYALGGILCDEYSVYKEGHAYGLCVIKGQLV